MRLLRLGTPFLIAYLCIGTLHVEGAEPRRSKARKPKAATTASSTKPGAGSKSKKEAPISYNYVYKKLRAKKVSGRFIRALEEQKDPSIHDAVIRLNVLGFLRTADYSGHLTRIAEDQCKRFMRDHAQSLFLAEKNHGIPKEVITALLWVETRHGGNLGKFSTPAVYLNLAMADRPASIKMTTELMLDEVGKDHPKVKEYKKKIVEVSKRKSKWAIEQLLALNQMFRTSGADVLKITGSYAGAFGWPQFIPASYLKWAQSSESERKSPDLFQPDDAIQSVGFYLKSHGWEATPEKMREALFGYNRSTDYVETILTLAERIK